MRRCFLALCLITACATRRPSGHDPPAQSGRAPAPPPSAVVASDAGLDARAGPKGDADGGRLAELGFKITKTYTERRFAWHQVESVSWQAEAAKLPPLPPEPAVDTRGCPPEMVRAKGNYLLDKRGRDDTDEPIILQNRACAHFRTADHGVNALCDRFDRDKWLAIAATLPRKVVDFCIDRYEFPDTYGELPLVVVRYAEGEQYCRKVGKRLCTESEWTFACEGEEGVPYPYGYERDATACRIDVIAAGPDADTFRPRTLEHTARGIDFAWQGKRSGESLRCASPLGVMDMTGNVDEWTVNTRKYGYKMILKGGHWGPARQRCRPATRGHGPNYVRYDEGFRCCTDAP